MNPERQDDKLPPHHHHHHHHYAVTHLAYTPEYLTHNVENPEPPAPKIRPPMIYDLSSTRLNEPQAAGKMTLIWLIRLPGHGDTHLQRTPLGILR